MRGFPPPRSGHSLIFYLDLRYTSGAADVGPDDRCTPG